MSGVYIQVRNDDGDLITLANYIERDGWELVENTEEGSVGISTLFMDDIDESIWDELGLNIGARHQLVIRDYTTNAILYYGYTATRGIKRRYDTYGNDLGRAWSIEVWDVNAIINRRVLTHAGARRPRETDVARIQWLTSVAHEWDIIHQFMIATTPTKMMSKADYRGQMVGELISDCSQQSGKNFWVAIADDGDGDRITFWYGKDSRDYYHSTLSISNDPADLDLAALGAGTTTLVYPPAKDTEYTMDPSRIFTGIYGRWAKGAVYRHLSTADHQFERWDTAMEWPNVHEKDRAIDRAENMLDRLAAAGEDVRIESGIEVPAAQAHLVRSGMIIPVKLTHVPSMVDYVDCRILKRGLLPFADGTRYRMPLTLEPLGSSNTSSCSTVVGDIIIEKLDNQSHAAGAVVLPITPESGSDCVIFGNAIALWGPINMHASGSMTELFSFGTADIDHPTAAHMYRAVAAAAGSYNITATYTNSGHWAAAGVAIKTSATSPVQDKSDHGFAVSVTLDNPPTPGNVLVMQITERDNESPAPGDPIPNGFWTRQGDAAHAHFEIAGDLTAIYTHCVVEGDVDGPFGSISDTSGVTVSEWEIT